MARRRDPVHPHAVGLGSAFGVGNRPDAKPGTYSLQNIIDGKFDAQLRAWADAARNTNIPIVMEYGDEENADWGAWAGIWNGAGDTTGYGDPNFPDGPERFRDAYRHMVTLFQDEGATNVTWVFHMVEWFGPNHPWESFANYYPGNDYVDWIALSLFAENNQPAIPARVGVNGLALVVEAAEALHFLFDYDSSGLTFAVRSFGRSAVRQ